MILLLFGSDELWNLANPSFEHKIEYFGYNLGCNHIIAYAPSCNNTTVEYFKEYYDDQTVDFSNFSKLSARDQNTKTLLKAIEGQDVPCVLDPTLLMESFEKFSQKGKIQQRYVLIYGYIFLEEEKRRIIDFAQKYNLEIYSIGFNHEWADKVIYGGIAEFLHYMNNATYVITNTFHGTLFAIIYEKKFASFAKTNHKIHYILDFFDLKDRDFTKSTELDKNKIDNIDYNKVNAIKENARKESLDFIRQSIEGGEELYERSQIV